MMPYHARDLVLIGQLRRPEYLLPEHRVGLHQRPFVARQARRLQQHGVGNADLADVVETRTDAQSV